MTVNAAGRFVGAGLVVGADRVVSAVRYGRAMSITAQLRDSVVLPGGGVLVNGFALERRGAGSRRALVPGGASLEVHELAGLFAGGRAPVAVFPLPWPAGEGGVPSVSPDGAFAAFPGRRAVRAVGADGTTRWEYPHEPWGDGFEHGSCRVSDDGRLVWAHVPADAAGGGPPEWWIVLDAGDGRELARLPLADSAAAGSHHLAHPDGRHVGLCIGMGQDGVLLRWARRDGERLVDLGVDAGQDRILADVHAGHPGFLTVEHYGADLELHGPDGTVLARGEPEPADGEDEFCWDHACGFVDAGTVIASTVDCAPDDDPEQPRHWLLDAHTLRIRGPVRYPGGPVDGYARPLGDGTWLTYDDARRTLDRWAVA